MKALVVLCVLTSAAAADKRCVIEKAPVAPAPKVAGPACHRAPTALAGPLTREITKGFYPTHEGGKPKVKFPCDGLGARIDEIILETGNGHGGTLSFFRARRSLDKFHVRGIAFRGQSMTHKPASPPFEHVAGTVSLDIDKLRAATTAEVTEEIPPPKPGVYSFGGETFSSHDFHIVIRLVDSDGRVVERRYTGYESSGAQSKFLGLRVAVQTLSPITSLATHKDTVDAEDRALFADRFNAAVPQFDEAFYWWVMERYVDLARFLGTPKVIAGLLTRMTVTDPKNRSRVDARRSALEALANITGWNARDKTRTDEQAANEYLAHCR